MKLDLQPHAFLQTALPNAGIRFFLKMFYFTFPLQIIGITVQDYPLTLPFCLWMLVSLLTLLRGRLNLFRVAAMYAFVAWAVFGIFVHSDMGPLVPLGVFIVFFLPLLTDVEATAINRETAIRWFLAGGVLSLLFVVYNLLRDRVGLPYLQDLSPLFIDQRSYSVGKLLREYASFEEPSYYAHYLVFLMFGADLLSPKKIAWKLELLKATFFIALLLTFSVSGFILLIFYVAARLVQLATLPNISLIKTVSRLYTLILLVFAGMVFLFVALPETFSDYVGYRVQRIGLYFAEDQTNSSEGSRIESNVVLFEFIEKEGLLPGLVGRGFNNYETWLRANYSLGTIAEGDIQNVFSVVGLGTGLVGLALYLALMLTIVPVHIIKVAERLQLRLPFTVTAYCVALAVLQFAMGHLVTYFLPGLMLIPLLKPRPPEPSSDTALLGEEPPKMMSRGSKGAASPFRSFGYDRKGF